MKHALGYNNGHGVEGNDLVQLICDVVAADAGLMGSVCIGKCGTAAVAQALRDVRGRHVGHILTVGDGGAATIPEEKRGKG